jgi:AhpD family alkylhydroperoxidase
MCRHDRRHDRLGKRRDKRRIEMETATRTARMKHPGKLLPGAVEAIHALNDAIHKSGASAETLGLVHLRASQINGCGFCVDMGWRKGKESGESDERLFAVSAWRETPYFTEAERAALALAEHVTRLSDRSDPVPDEIWEEAVRHYEEKELAGILLMIAQTNLFNRVNVSLRQPAGSFE